MTLKGIDVSQWQGHIDWDRVKRDGVQFAMLRAGYGRNNIDRTYHRNADEANRVGIPIGIYWFSYAYSVEMAVKEARYAVEAAKQHKITYPIAFDLEYDTVSYASKNGVTITKYLATQMAIAFCDEVKRLGYIPMVYTNLDYLNRYFDRSKLQYDLWYAQYASKASIADKEIWQYTSSGSVSGIAGKVDMNYGYKNYGSVNPVIPEQKPVKPTVSGNQIIKDGQVHARNFAVPGLKDDGIVGTETRKARIKVLQQAMNLDYSSGLRVDGIWGPKSERALGKHTVRRGETQYMITALEDLLMLKGYNPGGLENPGVFGSGLEAEVRKYQEDHGLSVDGIAGYNTFKSLIS